MDNRKRALIVGAGFSGAVCAERFADAGWCVTVMDKRCHIGGNAFDKFDEHGILVHPYGPHIFHTNNKKIFEYLSRFTTWRFYEHRVLASHEGDMYPIPINRTTINRLYGLSCSEDEIEAFLAGVRVVAEHPSTSEEVVLSSVGHELCDIFFRGYTKKQWGLDLSQLSAGVAARIPTRTNDDDRYFSDTYQFMPAEGYSRMFERLLSHENISIQLGLDYFKVAHEQKYDHTVYTGPIDEYFNCRFGRLPYRSIAFEHFHLGAEKTVQPVGTVNYPNMADGDFTRITEFKHLTGQQANGTSLVKEFPTDLGDPYYPVPRKENELLLKKYQALADAELDVTFVGRLAEYRYYNMDQVVGAALSKMNKLLSQ